MLKGTTKIELKDVRTGKVESYEKTNMVTNAVSDVLGMNPNGFKMLTGSLYNIYFPIVPQRIGGILLCQDPLVENADNYYVPNDNPIVGYANNSTSPGTDPKRGSFNALESGKTEDGKGYKFVFDFATSQANGEISALGLTSKLGGQDGQGNLITNTRGMYQLLTNTKSFTTSTATSVEWDNGRYLVDIVAFDIDNNKAISVQASGPNTLNIRKFDMDLSVFNLHTEPEIFECYRSYADHAITTTIFASYVSTATSDSSTYYFTFLDGGDGYVWGFEHSGNAAGNSSGDATINWIKIKIDDLTFEEGTWTIPAQLYRFGYNYYYRYNTSNMRRHTCAIINNGKLYCVSYDKKGIYAIPLDSPESLMYIPHPDGSVVVIEPYAYSSESFFCSTVFNKNYDTVYFANGYIQGNEIIPTAYVYNTSGSRADTRPYGLQWTAKPGLRVGPFLFCFEMHYYSYSSESIRFRREIYALENYLATINNLETPIVKTADKTMKITYTLNVE